MSGEAKTVKVRAVMADALNLLRVKYGNLDPDANAVMAHIETALGMPHWHDVETDPPPREPGVVVDVRTVTTYRWAPYKPDGQRQMRKAGRWQIAGEHGGWINFDLPEGGAWKFNSPK